ncbi:MAG: hypothetical protein ABMA25_13800 [Ilumatobacteraceae bacterium]
MTVSPLELAALVGELLERIDVPWVIGGSVAGSLIGEPRSTLDIDMAIRLTMAQAEPLVRTVEEEFYVSLDMVRSAVEHSSSFNLLHFASAMKVDLFVLGTGELDTRQMDRRQRIQAGGDAPVAVWTTAPDDLVLRKLTWFRAGGEISDRQWRDVVGILTTQGERLDRGSLQQLADQIGVGDLLARALRDTEA